MTPRKSAIKITIDEAEVINAFCLFIFLTPKFYGFLNHEIHHNFFIA